MPKQSLNGLFLLFVASLLVFVSCGETKSPISEVTNVNNEKKDQTEMKEKVLRHVVLFKFKDQSSETDVKKLNDAFNQLPKAIPAIKDFEWGINDSPEDFHQGFTHCYLLTFNSEEDRDSIYTPHEQHQSFVASLQPHLEKVFVVDYWTNP